MNNLFKSDLHSSSKKLAFHKKIGQITSLFTFGLIKNKKNIKIYSEEYKKNDAYFTEYNELINKANELDKAETIYLEGIRVSTHTFADVDIVNKADYGIGWDVLRDQILQRDNYQCQEEDGYCKGALQVHHVVPLSNGGANELMNLLTLCKYHHSLKHDHMKGTL